MHRSPARWTRAFTAAALLTLPAAAFAQTPPPSQPPTTAQPPATETQPPATPPATAAQPPDTKIDGATAKQHLSEARDTLSQLTAMPEAAKLQGDARTQVSTLISNFNELITTQSDWRSAYAKVDGNLTALLGPDSPDAAPPATGVSGAVGTSGASAASLDPAVRAKLMEFRTHLKEFERSAGGNASVAATSPAAAAASDVTTTTAADQAKAPEAGAQADVSKHLDAISAILDKSATGALTKTQTAELKKHFAELRVLLAK
jgi:hypothetical protein